MKFHIVGNGESIKDILDGYDITIEELKNENKHIRNWHLLIPGTKLKIPVLTEALVEELNEMEPFIEDYYPKIKLEEHYNLIDEEEKSIDIEENESIDIEENKNINYEDNLKEVIEEIQHIQQIQEIEEVEEEQVQKQIETITNSNENKERNNSQLVIRYVYPQQYYYNSYYRPIVYVIPRR